MKLNLKDIFDIPTAVIYEPEKFKGVNSVVIDSRQPVKGSLFVAIEGERLDGHDFVPQAAENGAAAVLINKRKLRRYDSLDIPIIGVTDTTKAFGYLASVWRKKLRAKVISITGSNGKTSAKEILAALLREKFKVVSTKANYNNHIGVPLTIFDAGDKTEILVLEHGTNHFGEIEYTAKIAQPDYALLTNIGDSHLEYLIDREGVLKEKAALLNAAAERDGILIINNDDPLIRNYSRNLKAKSVSFGFRGKPDIKGVIENYDSLSRAWLKIIFGNRVYSFTSPLLGKENAANILTAVSCALELGLNKKEILRGIKKVAAVKGRLNLIQTGNAIIIDDTYNSNPNSMRAAIRVLKNIKGVKKRTLILGDMFELGRNAKAIHAALFDEIKKLKHTRLILTGRNMKSLHNKAKDNFDSKHFSDRQKLKKYIAATDFSGNVILVKGSRGMKMEEFLADLRERV